MPNLSSCTPYTRPSSTAWDSGPEKYLMSPPALSPQTLNLPDATNGTSFTRVGFFASLFDLSMGKSSSASSRIVFKVNRGLDSLPWIHSRLIQHRDAHIPLNLAEILWIGFDLQSGHRAHTKRAH
jgi:hypothetical protein